MAKITGIWFSEDYQLMSGQSCQSCLELGVN
jgi:hypothetical protein